MNAHSSVMWFRRLALFGAVLAAGVVVLGAWVRLTDAGLGCPDWPGCYGHIYPESTPHAAKAWHEMVHRYFAGSLVVVITTLLAWAVLRRKDRDQPLAPVGFLFAVVCIQALLGALTVTLLLKPLIVTAHLYGGLSTLGLLWFLSLRPGYQPLSAGELRLRPFAILGFAALVLQIGFGGWTSTNYAAVACPDFPTCQRSWWPSMDFRDAFILWRGLGIDYEGGVLAAPARVAIHFTHRLGAVVAGSILITLAVLTVLRARDARLKLAGGLLLGAVAAQISIGIATVHWGIPLALATLHNAGAAFLVICMVTLLRALWPAESLGMVPWRRGDSTR